MLVFAREVINTAPVYEVMGSNVVVGINIVSF